MGDRGKFDLCAFCPSLCMDRCPVVAATGSNTWTPQSKMMMGWLMTNNHRPMTAENAEALYQCTGCMSCHEVCLHEIDVETALFSMRAAVVKAGVAPWAADRFVDVGTDLGQIFMNSVPQEFVVPEAMGVLFPGAGALRTAPGVLKDVFKCFSRLGIDTYAAIPSVAMDSGYDLYAAGYIDQFKEYANNAAKTLRRYNAIMVLSPVDYYTLKVLYPLHDVKLPEKLTLAQEHIGELVLEREPVRKVTGKVAYHDSCITGRHLEIYDMPRKVLEHITGQPPIELRRHHNNAMCCGASGAWDITNAKGASEAGANLARMAFEAGAGILATSGCTCAANMNGKANGLEVVDIITLVARSLGD